VLGLITTKNGELENPEGVKARLQEAAQYVPLAQICLSPQCGFASTEEGNSLTEAQQWDKVRLVTGIAAQVW
ncbi:5-methyltetrahydropteroyltriglutamate--homocysteine S-methyltransferase, partial [Klebsiella michiganensis]